MTLADKLSPQLKKEILDWCRDVINNGPKELDKIARKCINDFYEDYPQTKYYSRNRNLFNMYRINTDSVTIETSPEFSNPNVYDANPSIGRQWDATVEYIYKMTFEDGYHGGFLRNSVYYWRRPRKKHPLRFYKEKYPNGKKKKVAAHTTPIEESIAEAVGNFEAKYLIRLNIIQSKIRRELYG